MGEINIKVPYYDDSSLRNKIEELEYRIKKLEGYELVKVRELTDSEISYTVGLILGGDTKECLEKFYVTNGIYEWKKKENK